MKVVLFALLGFVIGGVVGGALGVGVGLTWIQLFNTSCFEGYCEMLVFLAFMPIGFLIGAIGGAVWFGVLAGRGKTR